ncbi:hypothetical protein GAP86_18915 [Salmonella enterica]|nr:hypothetical protein [Salmonella enterica]
MSKELKSELRDYIRKYPASISVLASLTLSGTDVNTLSAEQFHEIVKVAYNSITATLRKRCEYPDGDFGTAMFTDYAVAFLLGRHCIEKLNFAVEGETVTEIVDAWQQRILNDAYCRQSLRKMSTTAITNDQRALEFFKHNYN